MDDELHNNSKKWTLEIFNSFIIIIFSVLKNRYQKLKERLKKKKIK